MTMFSPGLNTDVLEQATLVPYAFDSIFANYSGSDFDVYTYKSGGIVVATITVTWTSATKDVLVSVVRT